MKKKAASLDSLFPKRLYIGQSHNFTVGHGFIANDRIERSGGPYLLRFSLPPFQRGEVWTEQQKSRFIESLWLHLPISVYAYNESPSLGRTDQWLIDGQQRWSAIRDFVGGKIAVFNGLRYSDMTLADTRFFESTPFPCILIKSDDESHLEEMYNRLAYGGTPHA